LKYKIECKSILLQKALENFLRDYLSEDGQIISDEKGDIIIGKDIKKPFSKSQLLIQLEAIKQNQQIKQKITNDDLEIDMNIFNDLISEKKESFEDKLDKLIDEFAQNLKKLIKEEYGKK